MNAAFQTIDLTWPAEEFLELPKWKLRKSIKESTTRCHIGFESLEK